MTMISKYFPFLSKNKKEKTPVTKKVDSINDFKKNTETESKPDATSLPTSKPVASPYVNPYGGYTSRPYVNPYFKPETDEYKKAKEQKEQDDKETLEKEIKLPFPTDVEFGDYVKLIDDEGLTVKQKVFLDAKKEFFVNDVIVKDGLTHFDIGYTIPFKAFRFEKVDVNYSHRVLFLQFNLAIDTHGEPDPNNILRGTKNMNELFPLLINEKLPDTLVDFYNYVDIYRMGNRYFINKIDIKDYDFVFFGFATKHSNIPYYIQKYLKKNNVQFITYESYNLYDDKIYGMDIVNELGYKYLPTVQTIKLNKIIIDHVVKNFGFPVIVKITNMDQGKGVFKMDTLEQLKTFYSTNSQMTFIQKFIPNDGDTRIILIKNKVKLVVKRQTAEGSTEFRSNVALGGKAIPTTIPQEIIDMCEDISTHIECDIIGFDILKDMNTGEYYVMEINVSPHFSTFSVVTGVNIPGILTDYIVSKITGIEPKPIEVIEEVHTQEVIETPTEQVGEEPTEKVTEQE